MMRKLAFVFLFLVVGAICYLGISISKKLQTKQAIQKRIKELPAFSLSNIDGNIFHSIGKKGTRPLIFIYFKTGCHFCQDEIQSIRMHQALQRHSIICLISDQPGDTLKQFTDDFKLDSLKNVQILCDKDGRIKHLFGVHGVPSTFLYATDGHLIKSFKGETDAEVLYQLVEK